MAERPVHTAEEYEAWLLREEIDIAATTSIDRLRAFLIERQEREPGKYGYPTEAQVQMMWESSERLLSWGEAAMKPFQQEVGLETRTRYGIKGMRGAFGFERARTIWESRTGGFFPEWPGKK